MRQARQLDEYYEVEEEILAKKRLSQSVEAMLMSDFGTPEDKVSGLNGW